MQTNQPSFILGKILTIGSFFVWLISFFMGLSGMNESFTIPANYKPYIIVAGLFCLFASTFLAAVSGKKRYIVFGFIAGIPTLFVLTALMAS